MSKQSRKKSSTARSVAGSVRGSAGKPGRAAKTSAAAVKKAAKTATKPATKTATTTKSAAKGAKGAKGTKAGASKGSTTAMSRTEVARKPATKTAAKAAMKPAKPAAASKRESTPPAAGLAEGHKAPDFTLPRDGGATVSLADYAGQKLVLFFYPKANTPGCTKEAIDFTRLAPDFAAAGAAVLGVSADSVKAQDSFRDKHALAVPLISDQHHEMLTAYGAWGEKSLYGRKFLGIIRSTVLIDRDGRIAKVWRNVKVDGHADAVLAAARDL